MPRLASAGDPTDKEDTGAPIAVLFVHYGDEWIRGSEAVLLDLLKALNKDRIRPVVWCNGAEMAAAATAAGYPTYRSEFRYFLDYDSPRLDVSHFFRLVRTCRMICNEHSVRVLHSNSAAPSQWLVPAALAARLPVLVHLHADYGRRSRFALLLHATTLVVGVSHHVTDSLLADGMQPSRIRVIYNGIDTARLSRPATDLRTALKIPSDAFVVATTGSLIPLKGHSILIRAFHALPLQPTPQHLLILGDGPERKELELLAASLGMGNRVHFLGSAHDPTPVYQAADVFALASRREAFGLVLAEAGYFALPSVSTLVGGIPEVVLDEQTGLLVPPDDVKAFSAALARLMRDQSLRLKLGTAASVRAKARFTAERMAHQFEEVYATLAAVPSTRLGWGSVLRKSRPYVQLLTRVSGRRLRSRNFAEHDLIGRCR